MDNRRAGVVAVTGLAVGTVAWKRWLAANPEPVRGRFGNGMEYGRWGDGAKTMLWIQGGPGSDVPGGTFGRLFGAQYRPFVADGYTVWTVTRRREMPAGHTVAAMADDHAALIRDEFAGRVDVVVGISYGGMIAQYLAAFHADCFTYVVLALSGLRVSEWGKDVDRRWAQARMAGRWAEAGEVAAEYLLPGPRWAGLRRLVGPAFGLPFRAEQTPAGDLRVEIEAELSFDSRPALPRITVPVLLLVGEEDRFFTPAIIAETVDLLPDCTVVRYPGKGHAGAAMSSRLAADILDWTHRQDARAPGST